MSPLLETRLPPHLPALPLVGRGPDLRAVQDAVRRFGAGEGAVVFVTGEGGVGKTRLATAVSDGLRRGGWTVLEGRAYAVEVGVPFAVFSEAFVPLLDSLGEGALSVATRGSVDSLRRLFPSIERPGSAELAGVRELDSRAHLFWGVCRLLEGMSARTPVLVVLDDLQWSDPSSMELLHFVARRVARLPVVLLASINEDERAAHPTLAGVEDSLAALGLSHTHRLEPLSSPAVAALVRGTFGVGLEASGRFAARLHERTGGNPLMIEATLATLVEGGDLVLAGGVWAGWEATEVDPPRSVREAMSRRLDRQPEEWRGVAEVVAVAGARARHDVLRHASGMAEPRLAEALEGLLHAGLLREGADGGWPLYDVRNPLVRDVLLGRIGRARAALLHLRVAEALEAVWVVDGNEPVDDLAFHYMKAAMGEIPRRAVPYLAAAGRHALARFANAEAAEYLRLALRYAEPDGAERLALVEDLGRALRRLGEVDQAVSLWYGAAESAREQSEHGSRARLLHRIGLAHFFAGEPSVALNVYDDALDAARRADDGRTLGRVLVARGSCLQSVGRVGEAEAALLEALELAEARGDAAPRARAHRALLLFHTWSGPPAQARFHGLEAITRADASGDPALACTCHWAQAVLEGLSGQSARCVHHLEAARRLNEEVDSPLLHLAIAEVQVEYAFGSGDWSTAIALGEDAIALCRALGQQALLPRLLVWTGLVHLGRGTDERAGAYLREAATVAGVEAPRGGRDIHSVVPAYIGEAARHLALGDVDAAVCVAREALAIVDGTGYRRWAAHRLLPILAEACLIARDLEGAREVSERMRAEGVALDDPLALAWAEACGALTLWLGGSGEEAAEALRAAAERLEAVPYLPDALRVRRRLAACLADLGRRDEAIYELRRLHDGFDRMGAEREIEKTRLALREIGSRPPVRAAAPGVHGLTGRECEVVALVAEGRSNKSIGRALGISDRTAERHLTNIYRKLGVRSRAELAEVAPTLPRQA